MARHDNHVRAVLVDIFAVFSTSTTDKPLANQQCYQLFRIDRSVISFAHTLLRKHKLTIFHHLLGKINIDWQEF